MARISTKVQPVALSCHSNQQLSNWTQGPLNRKEIRPGTRNLASFVGAGEVMDLRKYSTATTLLNKVIPYDILNLTAQISVANTPHQRRPSLQQMEIITESHD